MWSYFYAISDSITFLQQNIIKYIEENGTFRGFNKVKKEFYEQNPLFPDGIGLRLPPLLYFIPAFFIFAGIIIIF